MSWPPEVICPSCPVQSTMCNQCIPKQLITSTVFRDCKSEFPKNMTRVSCFIQTLLGTHFYVLHTEVFSQRLLQHNTKKGNIHLIRTFNIKMWSSFPEELQLEQQFLPLWQTPRGNLLLALWWYKSAEKMRK